MDYLAPPIPLISRVTDDSQRLAPCGCVAVSVPTFWAGFERARLA
jgi:hypothetical protein